MALNLTETCGLVNASSVGSGDQVVTRPQDGFRHMFLVTISAAANVWVEAAVEGASLRWIPVSGTITTTGNIAVEGNFSNLRVAWSANTGDVTVDLIQSAQAPAYY